MQSEVLGAAGEAGWGPEAVEGQGTAGLGTQAPWRKMIQGAQMRGSSSPGLKMMTGTERQGSWQVSPPGQTLSGQHGRGLCHKQG